MTRAPRKISIEEWNGRRLALLESGLSEASYGGPLSRHALNGDRRLYHLRFDDSAAALRLWNFLLTEEDRLRDARRDGKLIVGAVKDLGTVPVMVFSLANAIAFYPDGAWWLPCFKEEQDGLLPLADALGVDDSFCPVRAVLGAFQSGAHFPIPDLLVCSSGAVCDDMSAIAQRIHAMGHPVFWWEIPHRRHPDPGEDAVILPGGFTAPAAQVQFVRDELGRVRSHLEQRANERLDDAKLAGGIREANRVRRRIERLRRVVYSVDRCPLPALEMLIAEMLALHYCSDRQETVRVLDDLLEEAQRRVDADTGVLSADAARVFWVNPVADLRVMNLLEECGGRLCGTEFLFCHALDPIRTDRSPLDALACAALADPMVGSAIERAQRIAGDVLKFRAEAVVVSRIPGASHCATESKIIRETVSRICEVPAIEIEAPSLTDSMELTLRGRLEALVEMVFDRRKQCCRLG